MSLLNYVFGVWIKIVLGKIVIIISTLGGDVNKVWYNISVTVDLISVAYEYF